MVDSQRRKFLAHRRVRIEKTFACNCLQSILPVAERENKLSNAGHCHVSVYTHRCGHMNDHTEKQRAFEQLILILFLFLCIYKPFFSSLFITIIHHTNIVKNHII